jgi:hypothetical protein
MKNRKEIILLSMQVILHEYREKTHRSTIGDCSLCQQFYTEPMDERHSCHKCPMFVFHKPQKLLKNGYPELSCMERKCKPKYCSDHQKMTKTLKKVTEFYERAVEGLQKLTNEDLAKKDCFQYLVNIDKEVSEKYKVAGK